MNSANRVSPLLRIMAQWGARASEPHLMGGFQMDRGPKGCSRVAATGKKQASRRSPSIYVATAVVIAASGATAMAVLALVAALRLVLGCFVAVAV